ncbi:MAG: hypothetical protein ACE5EX_01955 [Phycisphaerae bacterium]
MRIEQIREVHAARPFHPFTLRLADGRALKVPHPEFLWIHPRAGRTVFVADVKETVRIIDPLLVVSIDLNDGNTRSRKKKR